MKLVSTLVSLLTAALIFPLALSTPVSRYTGAEAVEHVPATNAERFARGLPPLSPSKAHKRGSPTRRDTTSPVPMITYTGYIGVYKGTNLQGYMRKQSSGWYGDWTSNASLKLLVSFSLPVGQSSGSGLSLRLENEPQSIKQSAPYLGLGSDDDWTRSLPQAYFTSTVMTSGGPSSGLNGMNSQNIESNIWSVDLLTGALIPSWTTAGGVVTSDLWVLYTLFVGNGGDYSQIDWGNPMSRGTFKFVPQ